MGDVIDDDLQETLRVSNISLLGSDRENVSKSDTVEKLSATPYDGRLFSLGLYVNRQTVYSQQVRALNLVYTMDLGAGLVCGKSVAVIGGGIAGVTASVALAVRGARSVVLLERHPYLLHIQRGNQTRWIHPRLYEWPKCEASNRNAELPILNWHANTAGDVVAHLLKEFSRLHSHCGLPIEVYTNADDIQILGNTEATLPLPRGARHVGHVARSPTRISLTWNQWNVPRDAALLASAYHNLMPPQLGHMHRTVDAVLMATGFGFEQGDESTPSYWRNDDFEQPMLAQASEPKRILVSGLGDGALTEVIRLRIARFNHGRLVNEFFPEDDSEVRKVIDDLRAVQSDLESSWQYKIKTNSLQDNLSSEVREKLRKIGDKRTEGIRRIDARLKSRLRADTDVVLHGRSEYPLSARTSLLNTFLVWRLLNIDVQYIKADHIETFPARDGNGSVGGRLRQAVRFFNGDLPGTGVQDGAEHKRARPDMLFDQVIKRHGASQPSLDAVLPGLAKATKDLSKLNHITVRPIYQDEQNSPFLVEERWCVSPPLAIKLLQSLGFQSNSADLHSRKLELVQGNATIAEYEDTNTRRYSWNAGVLMTMVNRVAIEFQNTQNLRTIVMDAERGSGAGMSVLWWRFLAHCHDISKTNMHCDGDPVSVYTELHHLKPASKDWKEPKRYVARPLDDRPDPSVRIRYVQRPAPNQNGLINPDEVTQQLEVTLSVIDFAAARDVDIMEAAEVIVRQLDREESSVEPDGRPKDTTKVLLFVLDNFAEGLRHQIRRHPSIPPDRVVQSLSARLEAKVQALMSDPKRAQSPDRRYGFILVLDDPYDENDQCEKNTARDACMKFYSSDDDDERRRRVLMKGLSDRTSPLSEISSMGKRKIALTFRDDLPRLTELCHHGNHIGRPTPRVPSRSESMYTSLRAVSEFMVDAVGFRANPLVQGAIEYSEIRAILGPLGERLGGLFDHCLQSARDINRLIESSLDPVAMKAAADKEFITFQRTKYDLWEEVCGMPGLLGHRLLNTECWKTTFYLIDDYLAHITSNSTYSDGSVPEEVISKEVKPLLGLLLTLCEIERTDLKDKARVPVYVLRPRDVVPPITYSNLFSCTSRAVFNRRFPFLKRQSRNAEWGLWDLVAPVGFNLLRPVLPVKCPFRRVYRRNRFTNILYWPHRDAWIVQGPSWDQTWSGLDTPHP